MLTFVIDLVVALLVVSTVYLVVQIYRLRRILGQDILDGEKQNIKEAIRTHYLEIIKRWPGATLAAQVIINWQTTPEDKLANLVDLKNNLEKETQSLKT